MVRPDDNTIIGSQKITISELDGKNTALNREISELKEYIEQLKHEIKVKDEEFQRGKLEFHNLKDRKYELSMKYDDLQEDNENLQKRLDEFKGMEFEAKSLFETVQNLQSDNKMLLEKINDLENQSPDNYSLINTIRTIIDTYIAVQYSSVNYIYDQDEIVRQNQTVEVDDTYRLLQYIIHEIDKGK